MKHTACRKFARDVEGRAWYETLEEFEDMVRRRKTSYVALFFFEEESLFIIQIRIEAAKR